MKRRYALYAAAAIAALLFFATTSYGVLLLASIAGMAVLGSMILAWIGLFNVSERVAHRALRLWKAVVPTHVTSLFVRH